MRALTGEEAVAVLGRRPCLLLPVAPPGFGKSTLAQVLLQSSVGLDAVVHSTDDLREKHAGISEEAIFDMFRDRCLSSLVQGKLVFADASHVQRRRLDQTLGAAISVSAAILVAWGDTEPATAASRRHALPNGMSQELLARLRQEFATLRPEAVGFPWVPMSVLCGALQ